MGFAKENGYIPLSIETIMDAIRVGVNTQFGTSYTSENFVGSNHYKYYYVGAQRLQGSEVKTSEIFQKVQDYITVTNQRISRPVTTAPGTIELLENEGYIASTKKPEVGDAGKRYICVDVDETDDEYAATKLAINTLISQSTVGGVVTMGDQVDSITLSNGQSFDFKYALPDRKIVKLKLTVTLSENNQVVIKTPEEQKATLLANIAAKYRLGRNFEPQRYYSVVDAPWAESVLLEWSADWDPGPATWHDEVFEAVFDDLFVISLENIELVEA